MNYFKYLIKDKNFKFLVLVLLLLNLIYSPSPTVNIDVKEEIIKHKEILKNIENETKVKI